METLNVDLGARSYPIYIGQQLFDQPELLTRHIRGKQVMVVSNTTVAPLYLDTIMGMLNDYQTASVILPDGEQFKNLDTLNQIYTGLLEQAFDRSCTLIALGGGVVGDMTGYAAASYQRGVDFIQIPTTLLSQVDSSVGGKTGVNHPLGKNMIGAFHQPNAVLINTDTLDTLPDRELSAGLAEIIKYGALGDAEFFLWLENNMPLLTQRNVNALVYAIKRSCEDKAEIVAADELESGQRALLNLGHTFGHAVETAMGYGKWLHGEAVAAGMILAAEMSQRLQWIDAGDVKRLINLVKSAHLPVRCPESISKDEFLALMMRDKKALQGQIRLVLLKAIGQAVVTADYDQATLEKTLTAHHDPASRQQMGI